MSHPVEHAKSSARKFGAMIIFSTFIMYLIIVL